MFSPTLHVFVILIIVLIFSVISSVNLQNPVQDKDAVILEQEYIPDERGYTFRYRTSNGIERSEQGTIEEPDKILRVRGQYQYPIGGQIYEVSYKADENGYVAKQVAKNAQQTQEFDGKILTKSHTFPDRMLMLSPLPKKNRIGGAAIASLVGGGIG